MKKLFLFLVLLLATLQFAQAQLIPIDSCIVWQNKSISTNYFDISPDSKYIATSCEDGYIKIYLLENGNLLKEIKANDGFLDYEGIGSVKYSKDGLYLVSFSYDGKIRIFNTYTWDIIRTINVGYILSYYASVSHNNKYIASTYGFEGVAIWDFSTGNLLKIYPLIYSCFLYILLGQNILLHLQMVSNMNIFLYLIQSNFCFLINIFQIL